MVSTIFSCRLAEIKLNNLIAHDLHALIMWQTLCKYTCVYYEHYAQHSIMFSIRLLLCQIGETTSVKVQFRKSDDCSTFFRESKFTIVFSITVTENIKVNLTASLKLSLTICFVFNIVKFLSFY